MSLISFLSIALFISGTGAILTLGISRAEPQLSAATLLSVHLSLSITLSKSRHPGRHVLSGVRFRRRQVPAELLAVRGHASTDLPRGTELHGGYSTIPDPGLSAVLEVGSKRDCSSCARLQYRPSTRALLRSFIGRDSRLPQSDPAYLLQVPRYTTAILPPISLGLRNCSQGFQLNPPTQPGRRTSETRSIRGALRENALTTLRSLLNV